MAYHTDIMKSLEENLRVLQEDLISYETDLANLYEPFGNLVVLYRNQDALKQSHISEKHSVSIIFPNSRKNN